MPKHPSEPGAPSEPDDAEVIHPRWQAWVADNLARGAEPEALVEALVEDGAPRPRARATVDEQRIHALRRRVAALEQIVRLRAEHRTLQAEGHTAIARRPLPTAEEFIARYVVPGVPVVLTDLVTRWPALERWQPAALVERLGHESIEVCVGREDTTDPDAEWAPLRQELTVAALIERVLAGPSNDVYVIAKNAALRRPGLRSLLDDLVLPPALFGPRMDPARMGLWIGPAGTHTPLHHDGDDSMFCQVVGRKRFRLAPPESLALLDRSRGVYSHWDPGESAALADGPAHLIELVLEPGEALLIPAGWWHQVDALDPSISVSILALAWPNDFGWYRPGSLLRGSVEPAR
ncbi:cupin-like domain-containing protein [Paraliomyxa miuraensis]|uniref:cupin-like domain-containing protein n=1 Tax=Paraliomyxa miuraensis TaxID=376150 RepID=UPI002251E7A2|nr:cupin-like domain-containing protein [Paraliomyxa miuraensis]MCX4241816.1 cupin-like domain-containing protein [Paraliomyxa miuraensis]